ncbi:MAG: FtsQ-type POTRA domain-containing protein [Ruthenibacterium sp.]
MADQKRPTRLVYNYDSNTEKGAANKPKRLVYDYERSMQQEKEAAKAARAQRAAQRYTPDPAAVPPRKAPPFYADYSAASSQTQRRQKKQAPQDDFGYFESILPPKTVVTATREIPQRPRPDDSSSKRHAGVRAKTSAAKQKSSGSIYRTISKLFAGQRAKAAAKARRRQVVLSDARAQRRRRNLYTTLGILIAVIVGIILSLTVLFKIETITVEGTTPYGEAEIIAAFGRKPGDNLFAFNTDKTIAAMQQKLPYLETIKIRRALPSKVRIDVTSATDAYSVGSASGWVLLSESLRILRIVPEEPAELAHIIGIEALNPVPGTPLQIENTDKLDALRKLQGELQTQELLPVTEINVTDTLNLSFVYAGRIRILLGTVNELGDKIDWAKYMVTPSGTQSLAETERGTLDVSSRNDEGRIQAIWSAGAI